MADISLLRSRIALLEKDAQEARVIMTTLNDALAEDLAWQELDVKFREIQHQRKVLREQVHAQPAYAEAKAKLKDIRSQLKDTRDILSHELVEYNRETQSQDVVAEDGAVHNIVIKAKTKKTNQMRLV